MNTILKLVFSTFLLLQLGTAAFIPFDKLMNRANTNRRTLAKQILNNYIDEYEHQTTDKDLKHARTCVYYDYKEECHNTNDGCGVQTETCDPDQDACYTAWSGKQKILQGCWVPSIEPRCTPGECVNRESSSNHRYLETYFCCCFGDKCNEEYGLSNHISNARWP